MVICSAKLWKRIICFVLEFTGWEMPTSAPQASVQKGMSSPIPPTSLSLYQQTWSSAWCSLTTTLANREPACLIPPTPRSPPVRRAPPSTPFRPQQIGRTGPSPGSLATNRSTFRKSDFDMCIHQHRVWNCICYSFPQLVFQQSNFPVPCSPLFFRFFSFFLHICICMIVCMWLSFLIHHHKTLEHNSE